MTCGVGDRERASQQSAAALGDPLTFGRCMAFPLRSAEARREVLIGALWLLLPGVGWVLNMGHRIEMVHNMQHGRPAWPAWRNYRRLLRNGSVTFLAMALYYAPAGACAWLGFSASRHHGFRAASALSGLAAVLPICATLAIPGFMSHYCREFDAREIFNPSRALRRGLQAGAAYGRAWVIALSALALSLLGLCVLGVGFLVTSVWFWQVAGFAFASAMTRRYQLAPGMR
jgi:hypothetical protein